MKRRYVKELQPLGAGLFRVLLSCGHTQEVPGTVKNLPRIAPCQLCK